MKWLYTKTTVQFYISFRILFAQRTSDVSVSDSYLKWKL